MQERRIGIFQELTTKVPRRTVPGAHSICRLNIGVVRAAERRNDKHAEIAETLENQKNII